MSEVTETLAGYRFDVRGHDVEVQFMFSTEPYDHYDEDEFVAEAVDVPVYVDGEFAFEVQQWVNQEGRNSVLGEARMMAEWWLNGQLS